IPFSEIGNGSHLASQQNSSSEISPPAEILQKLSLGEKPAEVTSDNKHGVVFPNYIQALAADCSHLSFGTYKPGAQSPISGVAISDSIKSNLFAAHALPMSYSQGFPGSSLPREHALSQHAPSSQPFSQPSLTLEELAKLSEYAALSQNYALRSSSLQSAYEESSAYHDSLARMKNFSQLNGDASRSNFLRSDADVSGYGAFGRQSNYRESFPHDLSSNLSGSAVGYGDTFRSSVNGGNNLSSLSQNDISSPWEYGLGTRTLSGIQDNQYRGLQGYNQLRPSYKQEEQLSRNYSALGYGSLYASQGSLAAQEQWRDVSNTSGYQVPSSKQQQTWGQNY
ncbi:hypothetical protein LINPERPRIM_LOCUS3069, partial [Linum perenne]